MRLVQAADAAKLTGLTPHQLREWCGRRGVVRPDIPPDGPGRHALYSWQTLLALRLLKELQFEFAVEILSWKAGIASCQALFQTRSFPSLWGHQIRLSNINDAEIIAASAVRDARSCILIPLDPHLDILSAAMALPGRPSQLPLFPAIAV